LRKREARVSGSHGSKVAFNELENVNELLDNSFMKNLPQKKPEARTARKGAEEKHTYLRAGDKVFHKNYKYWGGGIVVETWASDLPGGLCFVRILFQDGKQRVFDNSFDSSCCCYYAGITLLNRVEL
jgi:hypothetical protein